MTTRTMHGVHYRVHSPSWYEARDWEHLHLCYEGAHKWVVSCWNSETGRFERQAFISLEDCARFVGYTVSKALAGQA